MSHAHAPHRTLTRVGALPHTHSGLVCTARGAALLLLLLLLLRPLARTCRDVVR